MSQPLFSQDILFYQRFLKANGFYSATLDGLWGKKTNAADMAFTQQTQSIAKQYGLFDARSETNIATLAPKVQILARKFLGVMISNSKDVRIISGTRTYAQQDALYKQGRYGNTLPIITNARGGQSNHNFGLAWDIGLFVNGKYITDDAPYIKLAKLVVPAIPMLEWGGNWQSFKDYPHYQHQAIDDTVAGTRALFETGAVYV